DPDPEIDEQRIRNLLARFGLTGEQVYQKVGELSGGEKSRAALARLVALGVNVLILDEPTNHLDLWACDALEQALLAFEGTVLVVSPARYFLTRVAELLLVLEGDGRVQVIHGNYDTYELMRAAAGDQPSVIGEKVSDGQKPKTEGRQPTADSRKRKRRF